LTGLDVGHPVTINSGVDVAAMLEVKEREGYIVISYSGVVVLVPVPDILPVTVMLDVIDDVGTKDADMLLLPVTVIVGVTESDSVMEPVGLLLDVTVIVFVTVEDAVKDLVIDGVAGATVPLTEAASLPTVISIPHA